MSINKKDGLMNKKPNSKQRIKSVSSNEKGNDIGNTILLICGILFAFNSDILLYAIGGLLGIILVIHLL